MGHVRDGRDNSGYLSYLYVNFVDCKAKNTWQMIYIKSSYLFDSNWPLIFVMSKVINLEAKTPAPMQAEAQMLWQCMASLSTAFNEEFFFLIWWKSKLIVIYYLNLVTSYKKSHWDLSLYKQDWIISKIFHDRDVT